MFVFYLFTQDYFTFFNIVFKDVYFFSFKKEDSKGMQLFLEAKQVCGMWEQVTCSLSVREGKSL